MIEAGVYQEFTVRAIRGGNKGFGRIRGGENNWPQVLLRAHGKSGARVSRYIFYGPLGQEDHAETWWDARTGIAYKTRAGAAQADYDSYIEDWNRMIRNPEL